MISKYAEYTSQLGTVIDEDETHNLGGGSTDMGNVSYEVPSIHPDFAILYSKIIWIYICQFF